MIWNTNLEFFYKKLLLKNILLQIKTKFIKRMYKAKDFGLLICEVWGGGGGGVLNHLFIIIIDPKA